MSQLQKNAYLLPTVTTSVLLWEQNQTAESGTTSAIAFRTIGSAVTSSTQFIGRSQNGTNSSGLVLDNELVVAYEVKRTNNKNSVALAHIDLK